MKIKEAASFIVMQPLYFRWCHQESNRGHKDFQSFALKTFKSLAYGSTFKGNQLSYCTLTVIL